jgi:hypothetical protein
MALVVPDRAPPHGASVKPLGKVMASREPAGPHNHEKIAKPLVKANLPNPFALSFI